jgi:hypothetical protein
VPKRKPKRPKAVWNQSPIWMVWVQKTHAYTGRPTVDLRSVCTNEALAELHRDMVVRDEPDAERIWIEPRESDHLYGHRDVGLAFRLSSIGGKWERDL